MMDTVRIGSRGSELALVQANWVADRLRRTGADAEVVIIRTAGDDRAPDTAWGEGAFVTAIEAALADGRIDLAVHSAKDLPTEEDPRLAVGAWAEREDPRDALVCRVRGLTLDSLPRGARVGTDSPRRAAFVLAVRPDLRLHALSGNVDTRLRKLDDGQSDALVLAVAGLSRLGRRDRIDQVLPLDVVVPAPGQGALALQVRADDDRTRDVVAALDDMPTRVAVQAERAFLAATGGGCRSPIGALGQVAAENLTLHVAAARELCLPDGATVSGGVLRLTEQGPVEDWRRLAESLADRVVAMRTRARVLVTRPRNSATALIEALRGAGFDAIPVPTIEIRDEPDGAAPAAIVAAARAGSWIVTTSPSGVRAALAALDRGVVSPHTVSWAVVGKASEEILLERGASAFVPSRPLGAALAAELPVGVDDPVMVVRGDLAGSGVIDVLRQRGATVSDVIAYSTVEAPVGSRPMLAEALDGPIDVITFASGSAVRGLIGLASFGARSMVRACPAVCVGPSTAAVARENGFKTVVETDDPGTEAFVRAVARALAPGPANLAEPGLQIPISSGVPT